MTLKCIGTSFALSSTIMISGLFQSASGMLTQMENHQVIAENLAASSVPGFRRNQASFETYLNPLADKGVDPADAGLKPGNQLWPANTPKTQVTTDFSNGQIQPDFINTHVALQGPGFFSVELPNNGGNAYTRNGMFHLNPQGEIVTMDGWRVLSESGTPLTITDQNTPFRINEEGEVIQGSNSIGKLRVMDFPDPANSLHWVGGSYFQPNDPNTQPQAMTSATKIMQGHIETSNVNSIQEMVSMIQATRIYEANQKMLQMQDNTVEQIIRQIPTR